MKAPGFWYPGTPGSVPLSARLLQPLAQAYGWGARLQRSFATPQRADVPVICIGNAVAGGSGKTPIAIAIAGWLKQQGHRPHFLTRGYGGTLKGPDDRNAGLPSWRHDAYR